MTSIQDLQRHWEEARRISQSPPINVSFEEPAEIRDLIIEDLKPGIYSIKNHEDWMIMVSKNHDSSKWVEETNSKTWYETASFKKINNGWIFMGSYSGNPGDTFVLLSKKCSINLFTDYPSLRDFTPPGVMKF